MEGKNNYKEYVFCPNFLNLHFFFIFYIHDHKNYNSNAYKKIGGKLK